MFLRGSVESIMLIIADSVVATPTRSLTAEIREIMFILSRSSKVCPYAMKLTISFPRVNPEGKSSANLIIREQYSCY